VRVDQRMYLNSLGYWLSPELQTFRGGKSLSVRLSMSVILSKFVLLTLL
jgi:hypothetical protein